MPKITKRVVDEAEPRAAEYFIWCDELPGFGVRIYPSGRKGYLVQYRAGGRSRRAKIGLHGRLTPDEARREAKGLLGAVALGGDPAEERATQRQSMTIAELCTRYLAAAEKGLIMGKGGRPKKPLTLYSDNGRIARHIVPLLGRRLVRDVTHADVARLIRDVTLGTTATVEKTKLRGKAVVTGGRGVATRTAGLLGGILAFGISEGVITANPVHGVRKPAYERRTGRLTAEQYRALGKALQKAEATGKSVPAGIVRMLALTGCRRGEVLGLRWSEVDAAGHAFRLADSKEGASVRPIGAAALAALPSAKGKGATDYVWPGRRPKSACSTLPVFWRGIAAAAGLEGVTLHTLRHSFASVAGDLGYSEATIGAMLGHASGSVTGRYTHLLDAVLVAAADRVAEAVRGFMVGGLLSLMTAD